MKTNYPRDDEPPAPRRAGWITCASSGIAFLLVAAAVPFFVLGMFARSALQDPGGSKDVQTSGPDTAIVLAGGLGVTGLVLLLGNLLGVGVHKLKERRKARAKENMPPLDLPQDSSLRMGVEVSDVVHNDDVRA